MKMKDSDAYQMLSQILRTPLGALYYRTGESSDLREIWINFSALWIVQRG